MARHKEKDDEAGGEGLGFLATRKRLWRDADGNIVNCRRPYTQEHQAKRRQIAGTHERRRSSTGSVAEKQTPPTLPLSPPISIPSPASVPDSVTYTPTEQVHEGLDSSADGILDRSPMLHAAWTVDPMLSTLNTSTVDDIDFLCNSGWGTHRPTNPYETFMGPGGDMPYEDDIFKPDTAMSLNAAFKRPGSTQAVVV